MRDNALTKAKKRGMRAAEWIAGRRSQRLGIQAMRIAIAIIFLWIGALKFVPYEADSITPFVANNPVMRLFYKYPDEYKTHLTREGELVPAQREWQTSNNTYVFSRALGMVELIIGFLTLIGVVSARYGLAGAVLSFLTPVVTLSFLITTPEAWVPNLGDTEFGFPYLSGAGRLLIKDVALFAGSWLVIVDGMRDLIGLSDEQEHARLIACRTGIANASANLGTEAVPDASSPLRTIQESTRPF